MSDLEASNEAMEGGEDKEVNFKQPPAPKSNSIGFKYVHKVEVYGICCNC